MACASANAAIAQDRHEDRFAVYTGTPYPAEVRGVPREPQHMRGGQRFTATNSWYRYSQTVALVEISEDAFCEGRRLPHL